MFPTPPPIWLIAGPTASGKSRLALELAELTSAEIIGADSMQLYRGLEMLTAAPDAKARAQIPHHLVSCADPAEAWSAGRWLAAALAALKGIAERGRPAIVVGGTGLYFRALTLGLAPMPAAPAAVRARVQALYSAEGEAAFRARLADVDPAAAARIGPADRQRLTRALEVFEASGRSLSDWQGATAPALPGGAWRAVVLSLPRAELHRRIAARLETMIAHGALEEVERLLDRRLDPALPAMKALGVRPLAAHLRGETSLAAALEGAKAETRRYAKRQETWFNHQATDWPRVSAGGPADLLAALAHRKA